MLFVTGNGRLYSDIHITRLHEFRKSIYWNRRTWTYLSGVVVPNGMIQPSPDTRIYQWDACSGYYYDDATINGFSHTHLSGTGCGDYGDVLLMPTVGEQDYHAMGTESQQMAYASAFSHQNEEAQPGYYSVMLDRYQVKAELTATKRAAIHRYTFRNRLKPDLSWILIIVCNARKMKRWSWR